LSAKFSAQRKGAFLRYLSQSGNITLSAERAKVSRSWVRLHRSSDAGFDAACLAAIAQAAVDLRSTSSRQAQDGLIEEAAKGLRAGGVAGDECPRHSPFPRYHDGAELVVESVVAGTGGSGGGKRVQVRRARVRQWTPRVEKRFLSVLAATCNVRLACAEVGMGAPSAYNHRHRWPAFARAWDAAVETGYFRLEAALVEAGCNLGSDLEVEPDLTITGMSLHDAMQLLHMHKHQVRGLGKRPGGAPRVASDEEVRKALARSLWAFGVRVTKEEEG
jgi:hypothetical protein